MSNERIRSIKRIILRGFLAGAIYIVCWVAAIFVNFLIIRKYVTVSHETAWWLYQRFFPGTADIAVAIILFRMRREKWWLALMIAVGLWGIGIHFYPWVAINCIYTGPSYYWLDMSFEGFFWGYHEGSLIISILNTLVLFAIMWFVVYKWKQGFEG